MQPTDLSKSDADKIIFAVGGVSPQALNRATELGVQGIVTSSMSFMDVKHYAGINFVPGITGMETINTSLILIEGFVDQRMPDEMSDFVANYDGEWVSMTGTTHIRAGALRPELILPVRKNLTAIPANFNDEIAVGSLVEIKRSGAWHGHTGIVRQILAQPIVLPSLVTVLAAVIDVNGQEITVPLTNIVAKGGN